VIMPNDVAHQNVDDVVINRNRFAKSRHGKKEKVKKLDAIPINGQRIRTLRIDCLWTAKIARS
jgi:hypothetical protein